MKILFISDTHFSNDLSMSEYDEGNISHRYKLQLNLFKKVLTEVKYDMVIHLGDLFNSPKFKFFTLFHFQEYIKKNNLGDIVNNQNKFCCLGGNHDYVGFQQYLNKLTDLNLKEVESLDLGNCCIHFLSWKPVKEYITLLENIVIKKDQYNILCTHQDIIGHCNSRNGVNSKLFERFDLVLNGHYHEPDKIGSNIVCCGSLYPLIFGDTPNRRVLLFDTETLQIKSFQIKSWFFNKVIANRTEIHEFCDCHKEQINNCFLKIVLNSEIPLNSEQKMIYECELKKRGCLGIIWESFVCEQCSLEDEKGLDLNIDDDTIMNNLKKYMEKYVDGLCSDEGNKKKILEKGLEIVNEVCRA